MKQITINNWDEINTNKIDGTEQIFIDNIQLVLDKEGYENLLDCCLNILYKKEWHEVETQIEQLEEINGELEEQLREYTKSYRRR